MKDKITVIVPIYNADKYLIKCIDSIVNQEYTNLEILLIDDGSKDDSFKICKEYEKKDKRIVVIHKENSGVSDTRNLGVEKATGQYIMFVDSDDIVTKDCCSYLLQMTKKYSSEITIGNVYKTSNKNYELPILEKEEYCFADKKEKMYLTIYNNSFENIQYTEGPVGKLYSRDMLIKNKIKFNKKVRYGEDSLFNLECYYFSKKIFISNHYVYIYYDNDDSVTHSKFHQMFNNINLCLNYHKKKLIELNLFNELKEQYYIFCYRQINKLVKAAFESKNKKQNYLSLFENKNIDECIKNVPVNKLNFKSNIKFCILRRKGYFITYIIYKLRGKV